MIAVIARVSPQISLVPIGSLSQKNARSIVINGYKAVKVTTAEILPFRAAILKKILPSVPATPESTANAIPRELNSGLNPMDARIPKEMIRLPPT